MKITINASGDFEEIAEYVHYIADQIVEGYSSGFEGGQGNSWSTGTDIAVTPEERYAAEDALRRLRDVKTWDECQPITLIEAVIDAINWKRSQA